MYCLQFQREMVDIVKKIDEKVIIWSIDDFNTLGLLREVGPYCKNLLFLIKGKAGFASKSKYCSHFVETETIADGLLYLKNNYLDEEKKPIVIISDDEIATYTDLHRDELLDRYILPLTKEKGLTYKYTDKNEMTALAEQIGILCPKSQFANWNSNLDGIKYPCIIKPSHQRQGHYNEFKFKICKNEKALRKTLKYVNHDSVFIIQQYIPKERDILVYGGRMADGKTILAGAMIRDRMADSGSFSHGLMTPNIPQSVDTVKIASFLEKIGYYGLFSFEYGMVDDKAYFFEVNLRNDGTSDYFNQAGANIPLAYVYSSLGMDYSSIPTTVREDAWFVDEIFDYENVLKRVISKEQWKKERDTATIFKYYNKEDLEPYKLVLKTRHKQILKDFVLKKFRLYIVFVLDKLGLKR